jgi:hypothetical protein
MFPDIVVTTKHEYEIEYKYTYTCTNALCGLDFGRQRKLDLTRMACGSCKSRLSQTKPVPKSSGKEDKVNPFGMFVKDHFASVKKENPGSPHKDIMGILSKRYREQTETQEKHSERETIVIEDSDEEVKEVVTSLAILNLH